MEIKRSHMTQAAELYTDPALSVCATNIFATSSARIHLIIIILVVVNNMGLGHVGGLVKGQDKYPMKKNPVRKDPVMKDQAMLWNNCIQMDPAMSH